MRKLLISSSSLDAFKTQAVYDLATHQFVETVEAPNIIIVRNDKKIGPARLPPELYYYIIEILYNQLINEGLYDMAFHLTFINRHLAFKFYNQAFGGTRCPFYIVIRRLAQVFRQLYHINDHYSGFYVPAIESYACIEMSKTNIPFSEYLYTQPWHFDLPDLVESFVPRIEDLPYSKMIQMGRTRGDTGIIANERYNLAFSKKGVINVHTFRYPMYVICFTDNYHHELLHGIEMVLDTPQWRGFFRLLKQSMGKEGGIFFATKNDEAQFLVKEFIC